MKKSLACASVMCLVFFALFVSPAGAAVTVDAAGRPIGINYKFAGTIVDERNGMQGTFSLTFSGRFPLTKPQMEQKTSGNNTYGPYSYNYSRTEYWGDNMTQFKAEIVGFHYEYRVESYQQYTAKWYSGLVCTGKLFIIWADGSVSSFSVSLNPIEIARTVYQSSFYQQSHSEELRVIYKWDPELMDWTFLGENKTQYGFMASGTIIRKEDNIILNGEIRGRNGRYNGLLVVSEAVVTEEVTETRYWNDFSEEFKYTNTWSQFTAMGKFGPYMMTAYSRA